MPAGNPDLPGLIPELMHAPQAALHKPFTDSAWLYEIKFDGYRAAAAVNRGAVALRTRRGTNVAQWYPETVAALATLPGGPHVLDGEICVLRPDGTSDFTLLLQRRGQRPNPALPITYCVFDLLVHRGQSIMERPLVARKKLLQRLVHGHQGILFVQDLPADANVYLSMTLPEDQGGLGLDIEGVMAKRRDSTYQPGERSPDWRKIKRTDWHKGWKR